MGIPDITTLQVLPGPFEILELGDRGTKELVVTGWSLGRMTIHPRYGAGAKDIVVLRVTVPENIKPLYPDYYDITSQTLLAQILPVLEAGGYEDKSFRITKYGTGPSARFGLEIHPV